MKTHKLFPVEVLEFDYPSLLDWVGLDNFLSRHVRYMGPSGLSHTHTQMHRELYLKDVVNWFNECVEEARQHWTFACDKLEITTCWANANWGGSQQAHHSHDHPMSCVSGIFYASKDGAPTIFENPYYTHKVARIEPYRREPNYRWEAPFVGGRLLLFPSGLVHGTQRQFEDNNRWSISFNTLPTGDINEHSQGIETTSAHISIPD